MIHIVVRVLSIIVKVVELQKKKIQFWMFDDSEKIDENVWSCYKLSFIHKDEEKSKAMKLKSKILCKFIYDYIWIII